MYTLYSGKKLYIICICKDAYHANLQPLIA